jgi:hypothetical protein
LFFSRLAGPKPQQTICDWPVVDEQMDGSEAFIASIYDMKSSCSVRTNFYIRDFRICYRLQPRSSFEIVRPGDGRRGAPLKVITRDVDLVAGLAFYASERDRTQC